MAAIVDTVRARSDASATAPFDDARADGAGTGVTSPAPARRKPWPTRPRSPRAPITLTQVTSHGCWGRQPLLAAAVVSRRWRRSSIDWMTYFTAAAREPVRRPPRPVLCFGAVRSSRCHHLEQLARPGQGEERGDPGAHRAVSQAAARTSASSYACAAGPNMGCRVGRSSSFSRPRTPLATMASTTSPIPVLHRTEPALQLLPLVGSEAVQDSARRGLAGRVPVRRMAVGYVDVTVLYQLRHEDASDPDGGGRLGRDPVSDRPSGSRASRRTPRRAAPAHHDSPRPWCHGVRPVATSCGSKTITGVSAACDRA